MEYTKPQAEEWRRQQIQDTKDLAKYRSNRVYESSNTHGRIKREEVVR